jgi:hypothetical protein
LNFYRQTARKIPYRRTSRQEIVQIKIELDYIEKLMYVFGVMMRLVVILVGIVWASLLLISWSGAGEQPFDQDLPVTSSTR